MAESYVGATASSSAGGAHDLVAHRRAARRLALQAPGEVRLGPELAPLPDRVDRGIDDQLEEERADQAAEAEQHGHDLGPDPPGGAIDDRIVELGLGLELSGAQARVV